MKQPFPKVNLVYFMPSENYTDKKTSLLLICFVSVKTSKHGKNKSTVKSKEKSEMNLKMIVTMKIIPSVGSTTGAFGKIFGKFLQKIR